MEWCTRGHVVKESSTRQKGPLNITGCNLKKDKQSELRGGVRILAGLFIWVILGQFLASPHSISQCLKVSQGPSQALPGSLMHILGSGWL